jgi:hypothetical protein
MFSGHWTSGRDLGRRARSRRNALPQDVEVPKLVGDETTATNRDEKSGTVVVIAIAAGWLEVPLNRHG